MADTICKVFETIKTLSRLIDSGRLSHPRLRHRAEDLLRLLKDISLGSGGPDHLPALFKSLAAITLEQGEEAGAEELVRIVGDTLDNHQEVLTSHIETHNCPTGDCFKLTPAPCQTACPAGIDVPTYVALIGEGKYAEAVEVIRRDNPFPWICGLVCTRPCEFMCVRGRMDSPVSIKTLKAFAAEKALSERRYQNPRPEPPIDRKVCVIGAGPSGLTAAYYLALKGYTVRVIEALPVAGGMMMVGIPRYRLPREVIDREVAMIQDLGVDFRFNTKFGKDVTLPQLKAEGFEAFFVAVGTHESFKLGIPGEPDFPQVIDAIDLLQQVALGNHRLPGHKAIIIGGGNVAIDAARTCIRLGCDEVHLVYRRTRFEMPADTEEVEQAEAEGVRISFLTIPVEIIGTDGRLTALHCLRARLVEQEGSARKYPVPIKESDFILDADVIIPAIGERVDQKSLESLPGLGWTRRNTIDVNMISMATGIEGIFAAGDAVSGPATVVEAIGGGKKAADAIDRYLNGLPQPKMPPVPVRRGRIDCTEMSASAKMLQKRPEMPLLNIDRRRTTFQQVELGYSEKTAREEAARCLRCDICRRCGECVQICRDKMKIDALNLGYLDVDHPGKTDFRLTEERCITCGACAANCPNEAMKIEDAGGERTLSLCGTILNRQKLEYCSACGAVVSPARYQDYIKNRINTISPVTDIRLLCDACARKAAARSHVPTSTV
ncbi:MAG: FAD-dependent oxidoreductase [Thermodesulfobacteriota bacterium]